MNLPVAASAPQTAITSEISATASSGICQSPLAS
jgi:hypothetical protein